jgi:lipopolysaccharide export system protein LptA
VSKYVIIFLLLLMAGNAIAQKKASKVNLISSSRSHGDKINGLDVIKVYNGIWSQDRTRMSSDSAYFYQSANAFDAFGHVAINQGDTLNIYSDKLNYNGNTKVAILTDNVKMVDKEATLTTNFFNYNTATRIGTYTNGGKLVSKTNTLVSQNGYYFAGSHDAYFRYNVVCNTNDAVIYTDTMRYNSQTRINYFYGPTRIYGTKDKDTLLTDNGTYNTIVEQALFTKNNLYKQGTKSLVGDTLFYDRLKGFGRAVKHVTFNDNEQKIAIKGGLGTYFKANDLAIVTRDPYVILVTEDSKDTTKKDTSTKLITVLPKKGDKKEIVNNVIKNIPPGKNIPGQKQLTDSLSRGLTMPVIDSFSKKIPKKITADSAGKVLSAQSKRINKADQDKIKSTIKGLQKGKLDTNELLSNTPKVNLKDTAKAKKAKTDSVYMSADTIETRILTFKELKVVQEQERLSHIRDTTKKAPSIFYKVSPKELSITAPRFAKDTSYYHRNYFGPPKPKPVKPKKPVTIAKVKKNTKIDSTFLNRPILLQDTARVRIIMAFHSAKIFKSDLQSKADSIFYSNSDSTIRCYNKPMVWTEGSQLSGDTINLILKNKKLDKMDMYPNAFIVNIEKTDSVHFNQVGGKKMRGFFKDSKLYRVYIDGNVESIYFSRDSATHLITDMQRSFSSRMRLYFKNNEVTDLAFLTKPDHRYIPIEKVKEDEKILKGFIWKPKDRPVSKESILPSYNKLRDTTTKHVAGEPRPKKMYAGKGKGGGKVLPGVKAASDSTLKKTPGADSLKNLPAVKGKPDSTLKQQPAIKPAVTNAKKDSTGSKPAPVIISPAVKAKKDTTN